MHLRRETVKKWFHLEYHDVITALLLQVLWRYKGQCDRIRKKVNDPSFNSTVYVTAIFHECVRFSFVYYPQYSDYNIYLNKDVHFKFNM